jgi:hypothetical protein
MVVKWKRADIKMFAHFVDDSGMEPYFHYP